jgi:glycosyltransferase involved in cell wall biosynthesis
MRIAIDGRELTGTPTGVGRYLAEILSAWAALPGARAHEFVLCLPEAATLPGPLSLPHTVLSAPGRGVWWEQWALPRLVRQVRADVLFAPAYSGPIFSSVPMVVTMHDVSFAAHPEWFSWRAGVRRRVLARLAARRAVRVLTVSDFSKREIVRHLAIAADKVEVIYSGATAFTNRPSPITNSSPLPSSPSSPSLSALPVVLYVGSLFNRRHIPELIEGFALLARRHPQARLELVGDNRTSPHVDVAALIARSGLGDRIRARSYVSDAELAGLYENAAAFAFLSDYEGFGLTPLEALASGMPIVVLDTEVAREIYGPAAVRVARPEPPLIEAALERVLFDAGERDRLRAVAHGVLQRYSWEECGQRTLQVLMACGRK